MKKALVVFSGGQDSTTCLHWAMNRYDEVEAITFLYGQKHPVEVEQAKKICEKYNIKQTIVDMSFLGDLVDSALTSGGDVNTPHPRLAHLPASFVPNRNQLFLTLSHAYAQKIWAQVIVTGVCETDYSGYPDTRIAFIKSLEFTTNLGAFGSEHLENAITIETPLMWIDKADTFFLAKKEGGLDDVLKLSHTCYNGDHEHKHAWGYGCGECPACKLREKGWVEYVAQYGTETQHKETFGE